MRNRASLIRALETYRQERLASSLEDASISERVIMAWIYHDNSLEGRCFRPEEVQAAIRHNDREFPSYMRPLLEDVRIYEEAIKWVTSWAKEGQGSLCVENLEKLHKHLCQHEPKEGARVRKNSPVHRDYHQIICPHREVERRLTDLFERAANFKAEENDVLNFAAQFHHEMMFIYPYRRQPGLLARLFTNLFLLTHNYPPLILAAHERGAYYDALAMHDASQLTQLFHQAAWRYLDMSTHTKRQGQAESHPAAV